MSQDRITALAQAAAGEAIEALLTAVAADSLPCEQIEAELAAWLAQRLQQARPINA